MSIEFNCEKCGQLLRVSDDAAGKQSRCPSCENIAVVPMTSVPPAVSPPPRDPYAATNPYAKPPEVAQSMSGSVPRFLRNEPVHTVIDAGSALNVAWEIYKANFGILLGAFAILIGISLAMSAVQQVLMAIGGAAGGDAGEILVVLAVIIATILSWAVQTYLGIGMLRLNLAIARGENAEIGMMFSGGKQFLPVLGASILFAIATFLGLLAFIIPAFIVICGFWMYYSFIVDRDEPVFDSFSKSWEFSKGNRMTAVLMMFISFGLVIIGYLMLCIGIILTMPLSNMMWTVAYLMITGQQQARMGDEVI